MPTLLPADPLSLQATQVLSMPLQNQSGGILLQHAAAAQAQLQLQSTTMSGGTPELSLQQLASNPFMQMASVQPSAMVAAGGSTNMLLSSFNSLLPGACLRASACFFTLPTGYSTEEKRYTQYS